MAPRYLHSVSVTILVSLSLTAGSVLAAEIVDGRSLQTGNCVASPTTVQPGETVTLDARDSTADFVEFDKEGDGVYDLGDETDFIVNVSFEQPGTYDPTVRADGEDTDPCGTVTVTEFPIAELRVTPTQASVGQTVMFDASNSIDPDGDIVEYRWDFDGDRSVDRTTETAITEFSYGEAGVYVSQVTVVDDAGATEVAVRDVVVEQNQPPEASLSVSPETVNPGQQVRLNASASTDPDGSISEYRWDVDGDGAIDRNTSRATINTFYESSGAYSVFVTVVDDAGATATTSRDVVVETDNEPPEPAISVSPRPGVVGQEVAFDASSAVDPDGTIVEYRWDVDGDGTTDRTTNTPTTSHVFQNTGVYVPSVVVVDDDGATRTAETDIDIVRPDAELVCTVEPTAVSPGEEVLIDTSDSTAVELVEYDTDGDGEYDRLDREELTTVVSYDAAGTYSPQVRAPARELVADCGTITVEEPNEPPNARFRPSPRVATAGQQITLDASNSTDTDGQIVTYAWDFDGDGTVDRRTTGPQVQYTYSRTGPVVARLTVTDGDGASDTTERDVRVEAPANETGDGSEGGIPLIPIVVGGGGLLGTGVLWYFFRGGPAPGGGGGGGGDSSVPKPKPKPRPSGDDSVRYETGVFALPRSSGVISVPVGFEPDLVLCSVVNGARTDPAIDRTAGGSRGLAHRTSDGITNQCLTVGDDARSTDQATCAVADDAILQLVRHESTNSPGRVVGRVTGTTSAGFDLEVTIPGDDPLAGGVRVLYQAFRTTTDVDLATGFFQTPTEPGTQTVEMGIDADHVSLMASSAVTDTDQLWTTNRGVGLSVGNAVDTDGTPSETAWGGTVWPESDHATASVCATDRSLYLLYQGADRIAGRTRASVSSVGSTLRLDYDRVYNGPHKLGSTARHPVSYLAVAGGETMRPAVGTVPFPGAEDTRSVGCGFEPAMVELVVTEAPVGEEVAGGLSARPLGVSHGTAIDTGDGLRQYVLHHSVAVDPPATRSDVPARDASTAPDSTASGTGQATADGGQPGSRGDSAARETVSDAGRDVPTGGDVGERSATGGSAATPTTATASGKDGVTAPDPKEVRDDGRAGLWLPQAPDGTIRGRDELRVAALTATGFDLTARSLDTDGRSGNERRPTVVYRAWPAVDGKQTPAEDTDAKSAESADSRAGNTVTEGTSTREHATND